MLRIVTHFPLAAMEVMMEETFGPVVGIQKVDFSSTSSCPNTKSIYLTGVL